METLTVIISSPAHSPHKFTLALDKHCSILELKEIILTKLDSKPAIADQRLIFGGRILDDKDTLEHVFEKVDCTDNAPTLHLVVSHRQHASAPASPSPLRFRSSPEATTAASGTSSPAQSTAATSGTNFNTGHHFTPISMTTTTATQQVRAESNTTAAGSHSHNHSLSSNTGSAPVFAAGLAAPGFAVFDGSAQSPVHQPMQYVVINGMPYLVPAAYLPMLHHQHCVQQAHAYYGAFWTNADGSPNFQHIPTTLPGDQQARAAAAAGPVLPEVQGQGNAQEIAARDQRRAASLWLLMKLAFGVYLFSQNGSIERIVLLHVAALIIFLHQTGRLRIVRRIGHPAVVTPQAPPAPNPGQAAPALTPTPQTTHHTSTNTTTTTTTSFTSSDNSGNSRNPLNDHHQQEASGSTSTGSTSGTSSTSTAAATEAQTHHQEAAQQQQQPRFSTWRSIEHALLTFVTSLVPAPQPDIDPAVANAAAAGDRGM